MLHRLVYLVMASAAALVGITLILDFFSDVLPLASTEPQSVWRFELAFLLTAAQWITLSVVALAATAVVVMAWKSARQRAMTSD